MARRKVRLGVGAKANEGSGVGLGQMRGQDLGRSCTPGPTFTLALHPATPLP